MGRHDDAIKWRENLLAKMAGRMVNKEVHAAKAGHFIPDKVYPVGTEKEVCDDIARRQEMGVKKYGTTVSENPLPLREWLQHQYEELLDAAIYCRQAINKIDKEGLDNYRDCY